MSDLVIPEPFRLASLADVPHILFMLRTAYKTQGSIYDIPFDRDSAANWLSGLIEEHICLVGPASCLGGRIGPFPFNDKVVIAQIAFWKFTTPREIKIFKAFLHVAKHLGATHFNASSQFPENRTLRYYKKHGAREMEIQCMGAIP